MQHLNPVLTEHNGVARYLFRSEWLFGTLPWLLGGSCRERPHVGARGFPWTEGGQARSPLLAYALLGTRVLTQWIAILAASTSLVLIQHLTVLVHVRATRCPGLTLRMVVPARRIRAISSTMRARDAGQRRTTNSDGKS